MLKRLSLAALAILVIWPILGTRAQTPISEALAYLQNHYSEQGAGSRDWAAIGLGENNISVPVSAPDTSSLLGKERNVLARAAQGENRSSEVDAIKSTYQNNQFGDPYLINDDIFGVLAVASTDQSWLNSNQGVFTTIASSQRSDGSFGFSTNGNGDGDITAAAIWTLSLASSRPSTALTTAAAFLHNCQNTDGGFGVLPGQASSIATSSWAMIAQTTLGEDASAVRNYLFANQQSGGYWLQGSEPNYLNTAYAVMGLSGQKLPFVNRPASGNPPAAGNQNPNTTAPTAKPATSPKVNSPSPAVQSPTASSQLPAPVAKKPVRRQVIRTTATTQTFITCSASASASASASGDSATASASASTSCQ